MKKTEELMKEAQKASDELYNSDLVYKALVDNYCKASALNMKGKASDEEVSKNLNALSKYRQKLHEDYVLKFFKELNLTNEDLRDMAVEGILNAEIIEKILEFKGWIKKPSRG